RGRLSAACVQNRFDPARDIVDRRGGRRYAPNVVRAGEHDDDLRVDAVELTVLEPPQDVLRLVGAPSEIGSVPAEEILRPVREELRIVGGAPAPRDRVADKINVDAALPRLVDELRVRGERVLVDARRRSI